MCILIDLPALTQQQPRPNGATEMGLVGWAYQLWIANWKDVIKSFELQALPNFRPLLCHHHNVSNVIFLSHAPALGFLPRDTLLVLIFNHGPQLCHVGLLCAMHFPGHHVTEPWPQHPLVNSKVFGVHEVQLENLGTESLNIKNGTVARVWCLDVIHAGIAILSPCSFPPGVCPGYCTTVASAFGTRMEWLERSQVQPLAYIFQICLDSLRCYTQQTPPSYPNICLSSEWNEAHMHC